MRSRKRSRQIRKKIERICIERSSKNPRLQAITDLCRQHHIQISFEQKSWLDRKAGGLRHQGVLCTLAGMATYEAEEIIEQAKSPGLLVLFGRRRRSAEYRRHPALGRSGRRRRRFSSRKRRSAGLSAAAVRASAGAASHVKVSRIPNMARLIEMVKKKGYWVCGLDVDAGPLSMASGLDRAHGVGIGKRGERASQAY